MQREEIYKKLDEMLEGKKSRNFLNHLIRSYLPVDKVTKVLDKPSGDIKCVITNIKLVSVNEILTTLQTEEYKEKFLKLIKNSLTNEGNNQTNPMVEMLEGRVLGYRGEKTDTYMSHEAVQAFFDWVMTKMLKGDKHINWLLSSMNRQKFIKRAESIANDSETIASVNRLKKSTQNGLRATTKLGDLTILQELKEKMERNYNK